MSLLMPGPADSVAPDRPARFVMPKLPHVTLLFWIPKTLAVTLSETAGDLLWITLKVGYVTTALNLPCVLPGRGGCSGQSQTVPFGAVLGGGRGAAAPAGGSWAPAWSVPRSPTSATGGLSRG